MDPTSFREFEWDDGNRDKNWIKHHVSQAECEQVFFHQPLVVAPDEGHSRTESRYFLLGKTDTGRRLFLVFTPRQDRIRVISARDMSHKERRIYQNAEDEDSAF
jgi:uncharacterized DUF497 family protein